MKNKHLDKLIEKNIIKSYVYDIVDDEGNIGQESENRNTEILILKFEDETTLKLETFCNGCSEDTTLSIALI